MVNRRTRPLGVHTLQRTCSQPAADQPAGPRQQGPEVACRLRERPLGSLRRPMILAAMAGLLVALLPVPLWAQASGVKKSRIDGPTRARMLASLAALILLGLGMMALAWLGARITQRYRHGAPFFRPTPRPGEHDWARRPLVPPPDLPRPRRNDRPDTGPAEAD
jgi:hypothetical protein